MMQTQAKLSQIDDIRPAFCPYIQANPCRITTGKTGKHILGMMKIIIIGFIIVVVNVTIIAVMVVIIIIASTGMNIIDITVL